MVRYSVLGMDWEVPMMAVRLYAKRVGFDALPHLRAKYGVAMEGQRYRHEMTQRQELFAAMMVKYPPDHPIETDALKAEIAEDLAMPDGGCTCWLSSTFC